MLRGVYPELGDADEVGGRSPSCAAAGLVVPERGAAAPTGHRLPARHHRAGRVRGDAGPLCARSCTPRPAAASKAQGPALERPQLDLLAYHFARSANVAKKREYLRRAGDRARADFANAAAIDYYRQLAPAARRRASGSRSAAARRGARADRRLAEAEATYADALDAGRAGRGSAGARRASARRWPRSPASRAATTRRPSCCGPAQAGFDGARRPGRGGRGAAPGRHARRPAGRLRPGPGRVRGQPGHPPGARTTRTGWPRCSATSASSRSTPATSSGPSSSTSRPWRCGCRLGNRWAIGVSQNNLGHDRAAAGRLRRGGRALHRGDAAQPRGRRRVDGRDRPQQPRQRDPRAGRAGRGGACTSAEPWPPTGGTPTAGRWPSSTRTSPPWPPAAAGTSTALDLVGAADTLRAEIGSPRAPAQAEALT